MQVQNQKRWLLQVDQYRSVLGADCGTAQLFVSYCAYGFTPPLALTQPVSFGFAGERRDLLTGHYALGNGYRFYNPALMRFNRPDSFSPFREGGLNSYAYCAGDPINRTDPTGRAPGAGFLTLLKPSKSPSLYFGNMTDVHTFSDSFYFTRIHKQERWLVFSGHGYPGGAFVDDKFLDASKLKSRLLGDGVDFTKFDRAWLVSCHSGDPRAKTLIEKIKAPFANRSMPSLAQDFATATSLPTKGQRGDLETTRGALFEDAGPRPFLPELRDRLRAKYAIIKLNPYKQDRQPKEYRNFNYQSEWFFHSVDNTLNLLSSICSALNHPSGAH